MTREDVFKTGQIIARTIDVEGLSVASAADAPRVAQIIGNALIAAYELGLERAAAEAESLFMESHLYPGTNLVIQGLQHHRDAGKAIAAAIRVLKSQEAA